MLILSVLAGCSDTSKNIDAFGGLGSNGSNTADIGSSSLVFIPANYDFGLVSSTASPAANTIQLKNVASVPLYISSLSTPSDPNFAVVSTDCPTGTVAIPANATCSINLTFHPIAAGVLAYVISAQFSATLGGSPITSTTHITGTGVLPLNFAGLNPIDPSTVTTTTAGLTWPAVVGASSFVINRVGNGGALSLQGYATGSATSFTATGLAPSTFYLFRVNAVDALGSLDANSVNQSVTTEDIGSFSAVPDLATSEAVNVTSLSLATYCTDSYGHTPSFMAITNQSDSDSQCSLLSGPYRISCTPNYKTGHVNWTSQLTVSCLLNSYPTAFTQTVNVAVTHVDRPPVINSVASQSVVAGQPITTVTASATDPNLYSLTYACNYDNLVDGTVASGAATCGSLINQDGSSASFNSGTGVFNWTPKISAQGKDFEVALTANDGHVSSSTIFVIHVLAPPPSSATSTLSVSSGSVMSGQSTTVTLQAKDGSGNNLTAGGATVVFSNAGGTSTGSFSSVTDNHDGTYSSTFTGIISGSATTLKASVQGSQISTALPTVTVTPGAISLARSVVTVSSTTVVSATNTTLTLQAKDLNGNNLISGGSTVAFSASGGTSSGSISGATDQNNGTYSATFTGVTAGTTLTIGATIGGLAVTSTLPTLVVVPGAFSLSQSLVTVSTPTVISGANSALNLQAKDSNGNTLTSGGLSVAFTQSGGSSAGTISAVIDNNNGTYSATFLGTNAGTATTIGATIGGNQVTSNLPSITVTPGAISVTQSSVNVSSSTVASGNSVNVTLQAKDSSGNNLVSGGSTIHFSYSGGQSTGSFSAVTDNGGGLYSATLTGLVAGTATTIHATINGAAVVSTLPTIQVLIGTVSPAASTISVSASSILSGGTSSITLQAKDVNGNNLNSGGLTVTFLASGGSSSGQISATVDDGNGTYSSVFTGITAGTALTIGGTIGGAAVTSTLPTISVAPGAISTSQSLISVSSSTVVSGSTVLVTLQAKDLNGNNLSSGGAVVSFSLNGGSSTGTFSPVTDNSNGTYSSTFTGLNSGSVANVIGTISGSAITSATPTLQVLIGSLSLSQSAISVSNSSVVSGSSITLTIQAKDAHGNNFSTGGLTATFGHSGGTSNGSISAVVDNNNGTYTASFGGTTAGTPTSITASLNGSAIISASPTVQVQVGSFNLSQSVLSLSSSSVASGSSVSLTLQVKDINGNSLNAGGLNVVFSQSGGTSGGVLSAATDNNNGTYTGTFTGTNAGSAKSIGATINGSAITSSLPTVTVTPGGVSLAQSIVSVSNSTVQSGSAVTVTLTAEDASGNLITSGGQSILFSISGGSSTGNFSATTDHNNGTYTATFTGLNAGSAATVNATVAGNAVTSALPTEQVTPGGITTSQSLVTVSSSTVGSGSNVTLTLQAKDANGNNLTSGGATVAFTASGGASTGQISTTTYSGSGMYTATFTGVIAGSATTIGATIGGVSVTSALPTVQVTPGSLSYSQSTISTSATTVVSGSSITLTLQAKDAAGNNLNGGGSVVSFNFSGGTSSGVISTTTDHNNGTYTASFTGTTSGTATNIIAMASGLSVTSASPTIQVSTGTIDITKSSITLSSSSVISGASVTATLQAKDLNGNNLTSGGATIVFTQGSGTSTGSLSATADNGNGTYTATFTGNLVGTARAIGATINGATVTSTLPTVTVNPGAISSSTSTITLASSTVVSGSTVLVTLHGKDAAGNLVTSGGASVVFSLGAGGSTGSFSSTTDNANGTYAANFQGLAAGSPTSVSAQIGGVAITTSLPTIQVTVGAISVAQSPISTSSSTVLSGSAVTLTLSAKDAAGNSLPSGGATVVFSNSGGVSTGTISATTDNNNGTYSATFTGQKSGTPTSITATINASSVTSGNPTVQVTPGPASLLNSLVSLSAITLSSGASINVLLTAKDAFGNSQTSGGLVVAFTQSGGTSTGNFGTLTDNANGTYSATFTGVVSGTATSISATISGNALTSTAPTATVNPGSISTSQSVLSVSASTVTSGSTINVYLQAKDLNGNNLNSGGSTIAFSNSGGTSTGTFGSTTYSGSSVYTAVFTASSSGSATNLTATIAASPVTSTPVPQITVLPGTPSQLVFTTQPSSNTTPSNPFPSQPSISIEDAHGNIVTSGSGSSANIAITLSSSSSGSGVLGGSTNINAASGVANFAGHGLNVNGPGVYYLAATASSLSLSVTSTSITIVALTPTIASASPITISYLTSATGASATQSLIAATNSGTNPTTGTYTYVNSSSTSKNINGATGASNLPVTASYSADPATTFPITVSNTNTQSCTLLGAFSSASCSTTGFSLLFSTIQNAITSVSAGTNILQLNDGYTNSNSLTVNKILMGQISNLRTSANDLAGAQGNGTWSESGVVFNNKYYFPGVNSGGYSKLFSLDTSGNIVQILDITGSTKNDSLNTLTVFNNSLYFYAANSAGTLYELYQLSTTNTVTQVNNYPICNNNSFHEMAVMPSPLRLYFLQQNSSGFCKIHYLNSSNAIYQAVDMNGSTVSDSTGETLSYFNNRIWYYSGCSTALYPSCSNGNNYGVDMSGNFSYLSQYTSPGNGNGQGQLFFVNWSGYGYTWAQNGNTFQRFDASLNNSALTSEGVNNPPVPFNGSIYFIGYNSSGKIKLMKANTSNTMTVAAELTGYATVSDMDSSSKILGVLQQSGSDYELYFTGLEKGILRKLFKIDTSGNVYQVSNLIPGGNDNIENGFSLPSGPSGINEFYFSGNVGTTSTSYIKLFKVYPSP